MCATLMFAYRDTAHNGLSDSVRPVCQEEARRFYRSHVGYSKKLHPLAEKTTVTLTREREQPASRPSAHAKAGEQAMLRSPGNLWRCIGVVVHAGRPLTRAGQAFVLALEREALPLTHRQRNQR